MSKKKLKVKRLLTITRLFIESGKCKLNVNVIIFEKKSTVKISEKSVKFIVLLSTYDSLIYIFKNVNFTF